MLLILILITNLCIHFVCSQNGRDLVEDMNLSLKCRLPPTKEEMLEILRPYFKENVTFVTNFSGNISETGSGFDNWYKNTTTDAFSASKAYDLIFIGELENAAMYGYKIANWTKSNYLGLLPPKKVVRFPAASFYVMGVGQISHLWTLIDTLQLMYESGCNPLPLNWNPLPQGWILPPSAMFGLPAPDPMIVDPDDSEEAKDIAWQALHHDLLIGPEAFSLWSDNMKWYGGRGFGYFKDYVEYSYFLSRALHKAFSQRSLKIDLLTCQGTFCGSHGTLFGNFTGRFLGEKPAFVMTKLRFAMFWYIDVQANEIKEGYGLFDIPGFFIQTGLDLFQRCKK